MKLGEVWRSLWVLPLWALLCSAPALLALPSAVARIPRGGYCVGSRLLWLGEGLVPEDVGKVKA